MNFVCLAVRVPKSGSTSLGYALDAAFADRSTFFLPDSVDIEGRYSAIKRWRFRRSQRRMLRARTGEADLGRAIAAINAEIKPGDLVLGGHFTYDFAREAIALPARIITVLRDPVSRCVSEYNYARQVYGGRNPVKRLLSKGQLRAAARYGLVGYLDWMLERREAFGDLASHMMGWDRVQPLDAYFADHVFHAGVLDDVRGFAFGLAEKLGRSVDFPWQNSTLVRDAGGAGAEAKRRIEALYAADFELYDYVLSLSRRASRSMAAGTGQRRRAAANPSVRNRPSANA